MHIPKARRGRKARVKVMDVPVETAQGSNIDTLPDELLLQVSTFLCDKRVPTKSLARTLASLAAFELEF